MKIRRRNAFFMRALQSPNPDYRRPLGRLRTLTESAYIRVHAWFAIPSFGFQLAVSFFLLAVFASSGSELFVSPAGNDTNPGTLAQPFATFEKARDKARELRKQQPAGDAVTIEIRGGDYARTNAFELAAADSGPENARVIWTAYEKEVPRLLGGRKLSGFVKVNDPAVLNRLPVAAREHVLQLDLHSVGIHSFGEMKSRGFGRPTTPAHCELFFGGKPMTLARWPNEGEWQQIGGFPESTAENDGHGGSIGKLENGFFYSGDRPASWKDTSQLWVHGYWSWDWANSYERVAELNPTRHLIKTATPFGQYGFRKGQRFYFLNVLEELDTPGEWFLEQKTGVLYFWPPGPIDQNETVLSLLDQPLLKLSNVSEVRIKGLAFEGARGTAIEIHGGVSNIISDCVIRNIGDYGVQVEGGVGHHIQGCDIFDTGDGGVSLSGGDRKTLTPAGHEVENCHFARQGRWSKCYVPAVLIGGVGMRVEHNLIHDHPHCAVLFTGNDHWIAYNEIHHIALETGDVGAIYTGRDYTYRGNRLRYNFIHHTGGVGMGSMGVYMDDCVSGTEIFGNIFYKVHRAAFLGGGRDHQVINNIFVDCDPAVDVDGRGLDRSPVWHDMVDKTMRHALEEAPLSLYRQRYPAMKTLDAWYGPPGGPKLEGDAFKGVPPEGNLIERNICAGKWLASGWHATSAMLKVENNLTNALNEFMSPPTDTCRASSFALKPDSAAWKLGFEKIPFEQIGLITTSRRATH